MSDGVLLELCRLCNGPKSHVQKLERVTSCDNTWLNWRLIFSPSKMTDKPMPTHVREVTQGIWTFSRPFLRVNLFKIGGRATAVRLSNGDVFLVSPVQPDDTTKATLDKIGKVKYLVAPDFEVSIHSTWLTCSIISS
jgi:hypothetical protein